MGQAKITILNPNRTMKRERTEHWYYSGAKRITRAALRLYLEALLHPRLAQDPQHAVNL